MEYDQYKLSFFEIIEIYSNMGCKKELIPKEESRENYILPNFQLIMC